MGIAFYLHFCYSVPSLLLYALTFYVSIRDKKDLKGPYYTILKFSFFLDSMSYLANFATIWMFSFTGLNPWLMTISPTTLTIILYINKVILHAQNLRCIISVFHRLSIIACPLTMETKWEKFTVPLLCLTPIWGAGIGIYALYLGPHMVQMDGSIYWKFEHPEVIVFPTLGMAIFYMCFTTIPSIITARLLVKHSRERIAERICRITCACAVIQFLNLIAMGSVGMSQWKEWDISQFIELNVLPLTRDAYTFDMVWFNFVLNSDIRRRVFALLGLPSRNKIASVSNSSSGSGPLGRTGSSTLQRSSQLQPVTLSAKQSSGVQFSLDTIDVEKELP